MTARVLVALCLLVALSSVSATDWANYYGLLLDFTCPPKQSISRFISEHSNGFQDRRWAFECEERPFLANGQKCEWFNEVNELDKEFLFACPSGSLLTGWRSVFGCLAKDRVFSFQCCTASNAKYVTSKIYWTPSKNAYNEAMDFAPIWIPSGVRSKHMNQNEDRTFSFQVVPGVTKA